MEPRASASAAPTCCSGRASSSSQKVATAPRSMASAAAAGDASQKWPRPRAAGTSEEGQEPAADTIVASASAGAPRPCSLSESGFDRRASWPTSAAAKADVSVSPVPRQAVTSAVASCLNHPSSSRCCALTASARHACRRSTASRWRRHGSTSGKRPSLTSAEARSVLCWPMQPRQERVMRRSVADGSLRHSLSSGSAPLSTTSLASGAPCLAIAARHQTASVLMAGSRASTRSHSGARAPRSTSSRAASAEVDAHVYNRKSAARRRPGAAPSATRLRVRRRFSVVHSCWQSARDWPHILPIAIIAVRCTDGAGSVSSAVTFAPTVSEASSAAIIFSLASTSCEGCWARPAEARPATPWAKSTRAAW
mmetsp:Transcript_38184/g.114239  ORF Transcript_38184/g.114239 Transcript_38184/m.114239 type:complete len:367 (-) Transcript_38184:67-1167(-)